MEMTPDEFHELAKHEYGLEKYLAELFPVTDELEAARLPHPDKIEDRPEIISGFAKGGKIYVFGGSAKAGKSFFTAHWSHQISIGGSVWDEFFMLKSRVLYFDTEMDDDDYKERGFAAKQSDSFRIILEKNMRVIPGEKGIDKLTRYLELIHAYAIKHSIDVVVIDCIYRLIDEKDSAQMTLLVNAMKALKAAGRLVIAVHHINKKKIDAGDPFKGLAGHSNLQRAVDGGILLVGTDLWCKDDCGSSRRLIEMHFMTRGYADIKPRFVYLNKDCVHTVYTPPEEFEAESKEDQLISFLRRNVPSKMEDAIPTNALIKMLDNAPEIPWARATLEKKLPIWVKCGFLQVIKNKPKRYYLGPAIAGDDIIIDVENIADQPELL